MSEEQTDRAEDENDDSQYEGWLTAKEAAELIGLTLPSISRLVERGELTRVKHRGHYLYDPESVDEAAAKKGRERSATADPGAATMAATAQLIRSLTDAVPVMLDRVIQMSVAHQEATSKLIEQLTQRCDVLEKGHTEMILTREAYLDGKAERDVGTKQAEWSMAQKEKVINGAAKHLPALIELASLLLNKDDDDDETSRNSNAEREDIPSVRGEPIGDSDSETDESSK